MGTINGVPAHEYSIETTEEKPWLKPGADITGKTILTMKPFKMCTLFVLCLVT